MIEKKGWLKVGACVGGWVSFCLGGVVSGILVSKEILSVPAGFGLAGGFLILGLGLGVGCCWRYHKKHTAQYGQRTVQYSRTDHDSYGRATHEMSTISTLPPQALIEEEDGRQIDAMPFVSIRLDPEQESSLPRVDINASSKV